MTIKPFKSPAKITNSGTGNKILESTINIEKKPKFILDQNDLIMDLRKILDTTDNGNYYNSINEHILKTWKTIPNTESGTDYLWNLLCNKKILEDDFKIYFPKDKEGKMVATHTSQKDVASFAALLIRIERFKMKMVIIEFLFSRSVVKLAAMAHKLESIRTVLKKRKIYFDAKVAPKVYEVTYLSTITAIAKTISESETQLRELLFPMTAAYEIKFSNPYILLEPQIQAACLSIAPAGFSGIEGDYYYIIRLLQFPTLPMFNEKQLKQWNSYRVELDGLLSLLCLFPVVNLERLMMNLSTRTINIPFKNVASATQTSQHTFSLIIEVFNKFIPEIWIIVFQHFAQHFDYK